MADAPQVDAPKVDPGPKKKRGRAKWIVLASFVLLFAIGWKTGLVGFGMAELWAATFPRDEGLLAYVPADAAAFAIVDPHQLEVKAIGQEGGTLRGALEQRRTDIEKATDIDIAFDIDKIVFAPGLVVARGRFDAASLAQRLGERGYAETNYKGTIVLERAGEDAIAALDSGVLLYGDVTAIHAGVDAEAAETGLDSKDEVTDRLDAMGWDHALLAMVRVQDQGPSLRSIVTGTTGPRAVTLGVRSKAGIDIDTSIEAASPSAAAEIKLLLEEKRASADALTTLFGQEAGGALSEVARAATMVVQESTVAIHAHLTPEQADAIATALGKVTPELESTYKSLRLYQLLF